MTKVEIIKEINLVKDKWKMIRAQNPHAAPIINEYLHDCDNLINKFFSPKILELEYTDE